MIGSVRRSAINFVHTCAVEECVLEALKSGGVDMCCTQTSRVCGDALRKPQSFLSCVASQNCNCEVCGRLVGGGLVFWPGPADVTHSAAINNVVHRQVDATASDHR